MRAFNCRQIIFVLISLICINNKIYMPERIGEESGESKPFELNSVQRDELLNRPFTPDDFMRGFESAVQETLEPCKLLDEAPLTAIESWMFYYAVSGRLQREFKEPIKRHVRPLGSIRRRKQA
jgi:hypothetical protein